ncbi:MAG: ABC transporter substrate-binding protein [Pseudomonadota bacterium]
MKLARALLVTCGLSFSFAAQAADVEVLHWWTSGGEAKSVAELKKMLEAKGHVWKDYAVAGGGGDAAMTALKARVVSGNPPAAAQIKGPSIQEWAQEGLLANIDDAAKDWDTLVPTVVADAMKYKMHYVAAPVNVHRVNWLWINKAALDKTGMKAPTNYDEFFKLADAFKAQGITPIAHGGQPWQDATVFESVALGVGGKDFYKKALVQLDSASIESDKMLEVFDTLKKLKTYIDKDASGRDWNLATAMVINNKAGMQFMGDWAKGEFIAAGKKPDQDYICAAAPGTDDAFTFNIDSFAMFKLDDAGKQKAQADLATAIMSPEFQEVFNLNKGSIPVRSDVSMAKFDSCAVKAKQAFDTTAKDGGLVPSFAHGMAVPSATQGAIQDVIAKFMSTDMSSKDAVAALAKATRTM